jgi:hypothetical protein
MYQTFDRWDALAAEPAIGANIDIPPSEDDLSSSQPIIPVGRDTIAAACLLRASASLRTKIRSGGGDEVYEWERWLRQVLWIENQKLAKVQGTNGESTLQSWQGKDFLAKEIEPASIALHKFRTGQWDEFDFLETKGKKLAKEKRNIIISQLNFLKDIIGAASSAKEAEILVLELLLRIQQSAANNDSKMLSRNLDFLPLIERCSLWMALARPSPMQRHARVFELLDVIEGNDSELSQDDLSILKDCMNEYKFGASASGKRLAAAILGRINSHLMIKDGNDTSNDQEKTVDLILPESMPKESEWERAWSEEQHEEWVHSLGNLALTSKSSTKGGKRTKGDLSSWEAKTKVYKKETWPLTRAVADSDSWNVKAVSERQNLFQSLMELVWFK